MASADLMRSQVLHFRIESAPCILHRARDSARLSRARTSAFVLPVRGGAGTPWTLTTLAWQATQRLRCASSLRKARTSGWTAVIFDGFRHGCDGLSLCCGCTLGRRPCDEPIDFAPGREHLEPQAHSHRGHHDAAPGHDLHQILARSRCNASRVGAVPIPMRLLRIASDTTSPGASCAVMIISSSC